MAVFLDLLILIGGILVAVAGASILVDGAGSIASKLKVSSLVIGMTVVAFGTSMPEFAVSVFSSINKNTGLAISNILGSNIFNILIILGIATFIKVLPVHKNTISRDIPMNLLAAILVGVVGNKLLINGFGVSAIDPTDGIVFISLFAIDFPDHFPKAFLRLSRHITHIQHDRPEGQHESRRPNHIFHLQETISLD